MQRRNPIDVGTYALAPVDEISEYDEDSLVGMRLHTGPSTPLSSSSSSDSSSPMLTSWIGCFSLPFPSATVEAGPD